MIKGFLTYYETPLLFVVFGITLMIASCGIEPDKSSTRKDIESTVLRSCRVSTWHHLKRQGSFEREDGVRHRIYRCYATIEVESACTVPLRMEQDQVPPSSKYLPLIPGRHDLEIFLDYREVEEGWDLELVVVSE